jgi:hypothetical protein
VATVIDALELRSLKMKTRIIRALVAALVAGTLLLAGTAGYGLPGTNGTTLSVNW